MNFANIIPSIKIPSKEDFSNFLSSATENIYFAGRIIKQTNIKLFLASAKATLLHQAISVPLVYYSYDHLNVLGDIKNYCLLHTIIAMPSFYVFCFSLEHNLHNILIRQILEYLASRKVVSLEKLQAPPASHNYNKAKECPITLQKLPEEATICINKTLYDGNALIKWAIKHDLDPITGTKINWKTVYKLPPETVRNILSNDDSYYIEN